MRNPCQQPAVPSNGCGSGLRKTTPPCKLLLPMVEILALAKRSAGELVRGPGGRSLVEDAARGPRGTTRW